MNSLAYVDFDYRAHFGSEAIAIQAQSALTNFKGLLQKSFKGLVQCGKELQQSREDCLTAFGEKEGQLKFNEWLASNEFGGSRYLAEVSIQLAQWYDKLPRNLRRLASTKCESWNLSWLQVLCRKASDELENFLNQVEQLEQRDGKITAARLKALATSKKYLALEQPYSDEDWDLIALKYGLDSEQLNALKAEAHQHLEIDPYTGEREVTTNSIVEALKSFNLDPTLVLPKPRAKSYSQKEVDKIRQEVEGQVQQKYQAQFEEIRAQAIAEYKAQAQQQVSEEIALWETQAQQVLEAKEKQIKAVVAQKAQLERENAQLKQQLTQLQSVQFNGANLAKVSSTNSVSQVDVAEPLKERAPIEIGENHRANSLEVAQTFSEVEISKKPKSSNLVSSYYNQSLPAHIPLKSLRIGQRNPQNSSSTRGRGFGHR